ncbi:energy-coupling factor ABC transporter ATP-binding protein [Candidatus Margulisiibacteriota bacterium]
MIEVLNLDFAYEPDGGEVLWDINIEIKQGEFVAILGPNGSGKTTLIKHFNALLVPSSGEVLIDGLDTRERRNQKKIRDIVSLVFQNPLDQFIGLTAAEDLAVPLRIRGGSDENVSAKVRETLEKFNLTRLKDKYPHNLSGGEQKLLTIASSFVLDPKVIVLDEPTIMLDKGRREMIHSYVKALNKDQHKTVVAATTDPNEANLADRVYVLNKGRVVAMGTPHKVFHNSKLLEEIGVGVPLNGKAK